MLNTKWHTGNGIILFMFIGWDFIRDLPNYMRMFNAYRYRFFNGGNEGNKRDCYGFRALPVYDFVDDDCIPFLRLPIYVFLGLITLNVTYTP